MNILHKEKEITIADFRRSALQNSQKALRLTEELELDFNRNVHELRVITKRLRSYWRAIRPALGDKDIYTEHNSQLGGVTRLLTQSRENHVNRKLIKGFKKNIEGIAGKKFYNGLVSLFPNAEHIELPHKAPLTQCFVDEFSYWDQLNLDVFVTGVDQNEGVVNTYKKAKKLGERAISSNLEVEVTHQWRKWLKYLMYQLEVNPHTEEIDIRFLEQLNKQTKLLGKLHDLCVLSEIIYKAKGKVFTQDKVKKVRQVIDKKQNKLHNKILKNH